MVGKLSAETWENGHIALKKKKKKKKNRTKQVTQEPNNERSSNKPSRLCETKT